MQSSSESLWNTKVQQDRSNRNFGKSTASPAAQDFATLRVFAKNNSLAGDDGLGLLSHLVDLLDVRDLLADVKHNMRLLPKSHDGTVRAVLVCRGADEGKYIIETLKEMKKKKKLPGKYAGFFVEASNTLYGQIGRNQRSGAQTRTGNSSAAKQQAATQPTPSAAPGVENAPQKAPNLPLVQAQPAPDFHWQQAVVQQPNAYHMAPNANGMPHPQTPVSAAGEAHQQPDAWAPSPPRGIAVPGQPPITTGMAPGHAAATNPPSAVVTPGGLSGQAGKAQQSASRQETPAYPAAYATPMCRSHGQATGPYSSQFSRVGFYQQPAPGTPTYQIHQSAYGPVAYPVGTAAAPNLPGSLPTSPHYASGPGGTPLVAHHQAPTTPHWMAAPTTPRHQQLPGHQAAMQLHLSQAAAHRQHPPNLPMAGASGIQQPGAAQQMPNLGMYPGVCSPMPSPLPTPISSPLYATPTRRGSQQKAQFFAPMPEEAPATHTESELMDRIRELKTQLEQAQKATATSNKRTRTAEMQLQTLLKNKNAYSDLERELSAQSVEVRNLVVANHDLESQISDLTSDLERKEAKIADLTAELERAGFSPHAEENETLKTQVANLSAELHSAKNTTKNEEMGGLTSERLAKELLQANELLHSHIRHMQEKERSAQSKATSATKKKGEGQLELSASTTDSNSSDDQTSGPGSDDGDELSEPGTKRRKSVGGEPKHQQRSMSAEPTLRTHVEQKEPLKATTRKSSFSIKIGGKKGKATRQRSASAERPSLKSGFGRRAPPSPVVLSK